MTTSRVCDDLPAPVPETGTLFLHAGDAETRGLLRRCLRSGRLTWREPHPKVLAVPVAGRALRELCQVFAAKLKPSQLCDTRCCLVDASEPATAATLMKTYSLNKLIARMNGAWVLDILRGGRLRTYFQPIVRTSAPSQVFAYECLLRGWQEDGRLIYPDQMFQAARASGLLGYLDREARLTAIDAGRTIRNDAAVFINFNPASVDQPQECLESTIAAAEATHICPQRFVFELVESERVRDPEMLNKVVDYFRAHGFRVALDDLGAGYSSLNLLAQIKPDFIKLDMGLIRDVHRDYYKSRVAAKLLELATELGAATVVEGIESPGEWQWAMEHGADYAQGYLFARPSEVPRPSEFCPVRPVAIGDCAT